MSSLFRGRRPEESRSGGKILRGRRTAAAASPYARPPPPPSAPLVPPSSASSSKPKWFSGLISGAGKLISSVFGSDGSPSSSSSAYTSDEDLPLNSNENEDVHGSHRKLVESNQGRKPSFVNGSMEAVKVISGTESKFPIEKLLMQETFSRDEADKLIKIIQSRVTDSPAVEVVECEKRKKLSSITMNGAYGVSGALSVNQSEKLFESVPCFGSSLSSHLLGYPFQERPDPCNVAVMEAKKWLKEKKEASMSKPNECGFCTLNTDMLQLGSDNEVGSPVDLAKSYMQTLPPWQSPFLSSTAYRTPPPSGVHLFVDETSHAPSICSLPSSKVLRRDFISTRFWDSIEESRRVRSGPSENSLDNPKFRPFGSSTRLYENVKSKIWSADDEYCQEVSGTQRDASDLRKMKTSDAIANVSRSEEVVSATQEAYETSLPIATPLEPLHSVNESGQQLADCDILILDEDKVVMEDPQPQKQDGANVSRGSHVTSSTQAGDILCEESPLTLETTKTIPSSIADGVATHGVKFIQASAAQMVTDGRMLEVHKFSHTNLESVLKEAHVVNESRPHDENPKLQGNLNGSMVQISSNGLQHNLKPQCNANLEMESSSIGDPSCTNNSSAAGISGNIDLLNEVAGDIPTVEGLKKIAGGAPSNSKMKSIERMLTEPQSEPKMSNVRYKRKRVAKPVGGRGRR